MDSGSARGIEGPKLCPTQLTVQADEIFVNQQPEEILLWKLILVLCSLYHSENPRPGPPEPWSVDPECIQQVYVVVSVRMFLLYISRSHEKEDARILPKAPLEGRVHEHLHVVCKFKSVGSLLKRHRG